MKLSMPTGLGVALLCICLSRAKAEAPGTGDTVVARPALTMLGTAIPVSNLDRAVDFYTKGLGLQATPRRDARDVIEEPLVFPGGGAYLILLWRKEQKAPLAVPPETQRVILNIPDLKALASQLEAVGYHLKGTINDNPQHKYMVAHVDDPDGNHLELVQRAP